MRHFWIFAFLLLFYGCDKEDNSKPYAVVDCEDSYPVSGMYFDNTNELTFQLRVVKIASDSSVRVTKQDTDQVAMGVDIANSVYKEGNISFTYDSILLLVDTLFGGDMGDMHLIARRYNEPNVINFYIFDKYDRFDHHGASGGAPSMYFAVRSSSVGTTVVGHELGHCLGLHHTHNFDSSFDGYNILTGDLVCDTPKSDMIYDYVDDCEYTGKSMDEDKAEIIVCNIMSYAPLDCRTCITKGQANRIRFIVDQSMDLRSALINLPSLSDLLF